MTGEGWQQQAERLRAQARTLARAMATTAASRTTLGQERAVLRMFGVDGLDRSGRPLASSVVNGYCQSGDPQRLADGVALPFALALSEYDLPVRDLALEIAAGSIDLGVEAGDLGRGDRRAAASRTARDLIARAVVRIDENRTASRELRAVLGEPSAPCLGVTLEADDSVAASGEARGCLEAGVGIVRIRVPATWELVEARPENRETVRGVPQQHVFTPAGSQRGLSRMRTAADEVAAERGAYGSLMTVTSALAAPEQAVVAAFERIDVLEADPFREIVEANVDPDRALADHAFAHRLDARSGCRIFVGSGPLALGPELSTGYPAERATLAGRALALQALSVEFALANAIDPRALIVGAVPTWIAAEGDPGAMMADAWLRAVVFADHPLALEEPAGSGPALGYELVAALTAIAASTPDSPGSGRTALLFLRQAVPAAERSAAVAELSAASRTAAAVRQSLGGSSLHGPAGALAVRILGGANEVLERFASEGWAAVLGRDFENDSPRLGAGAVVPRAHDGEILEPLGGAPAVPR